MITIYGYSKCSTVKKAIKFLENNNIEFTHIDNVENKLSSKKLKDLHEKSNLEIKKFFNTSGMLYREMGLKDVVKEITNEDAYELLSTNGMLVKRPILETKDKVLVGFKEVEYETI